MKGKINILSKSFALAVLVVLMLLASAFAFTACSGDNNPNNLPDDESKVTSVTITNKEELVALWHVGDSNRTVQVKILPESEADKTVVTVRSDNDAAVSVVNKNKLHAVAEGTAVITVTAGGLSDEVTVTVSENTPVLSSVTITNKTALEVDMVKNLDSAAERTVEVSLAPTDFNAENTNIVLTSSDNDVIAIDGMKIKPGTKTGEATITVTATEKGNLNNSVVATFTVKYRDPITTPVITFMNEDGEPIETDIVAKIYAGVESELPDPAVLGSDGKNLHGSLNITCADSGVTIEYGQITVPDVAVCTVTYSVTDNRVEYGSESVEKEITVYAYRNIFSYVNDCGLGKAAVVDNDFDFETFNEAANVAGQKVTFNDRFWTKTKFNMQAGKVYYAEATFDIFSSAHNYTQFGFSHMVGDSISGRRYVNTLEPDNNMTIRNTDFMKDGNSENIDNVANPINWNANGQPYVLKTDMTRGITIEEKNSESNRRTVKIAVMRDGDYFYVFVNDVYVCCTAPTYYKDKDTVPGLFGFALMHVNNDNDNDIAGKSIAKNITYLTGTDAQDKLKSLVGNHNEKMMGGYVYFSGDPNDPGVNRNNQLFASSYDETSGLGLEYKEESVGRRISPYIYFYDDFTFSFTFKPKFEVENNNGTKYIDATYAMYLEGKTFSNNEPNAYSQDPKFDVNIFRLGLRYREADGKGWSAVTLEAVGNNAEPCNLMDISQGVKFTVKRLLKTNGALYELTAQSVANPGQKVTRQFFYTHYVDPATGDPRANWDQPFVPIMFHENMPGTYSHIEWKNSAQIVESEVMTESEFDASIYGQKVEEFSDVGTNIKALTTAPSGEYTLVIKYKAEDLQKVYGIRVCVGAGCPVWGSPDWSMNYAGGEYFYDLTLNPTGENSGYLVIKLNLTAEYSENNKCYIDLKENIITGLGDKVTVESAALYSNTQTDASVES